MFLCKIENHMQGVIVIKIIKAKDIEEIQNDLKRYETLLASQKLVFNNNECVLDVYDIKYNRGGIL